MKRYILGFMLVVLLGSVAFGWVYVSVTMAADKITKADPIIVIIDRFAGRVAAVELPNKKVVTIRKELLPKGVREGDVIKIEVDQEETLKKKNHTKDLMSGFWKK